MGYWKYKGKEIRSLEDIPEGAYGFIYRAHHLPSNRYYIGKKVLEFHRTLPPLKGEKKKRKVVKESDWKDYYGSHKEIKEIVKEGRQEEFSREILLFVFSKKLLTYYETKYLFLEGVIEPGSKYINDNVEARYFRRDFEG